jgi:hypothetical protein
VIRLPTWVFAPHFITEWKKLVLDIELIGIFPTEATGLEAERSVRSMTQYTLDVIIPLITLSRLGEIVGAVH